jgi:hypothetical protein
MSRNSFPPNKANIFIKAPLRSAEKFYQDIKKLGLMAEPIDWKPIDWRNAKKLKDGAQDILKPQNQGQCGCCWAMSSTTTLTDLFRIYKGIQGLHLESLLTMQCAGETQNTGCCGGQPYNAGLFFKDVGCVHVDNPFDYSNFTESQDPSCVNPSAESCEQITKNLNMNNKHIYKIKEVLTTVHVDKNIVIDPVASILAMKQALSKGPIVATFIVFQDFMNLKNNIYIYDGHSKFDGCHAVEIVGWGVEPTPNIDSDGKQQKETPYWIIKNSWGVGYWGDGGYCKFAMYPFNKGLCLDVPDNTYFELLGHPKDSQNYMAKDEEGNNVPAIGGGTVFIIDEESGADNGHSYGNDDDNSSQNSSQNSSHEQSEKSYLKIILIVCSILLIILVGIYFLKTLNKGKKGKKN